MFSTLKLLNQIQCPEHAVGQGCPRSPCLFSHEVARSRTAPGVGKAAASSSSVTQAKPPTTSSASAASSTNYGILSKPIETLTPLKRARATTPPRVGTSTLSSPKKQRLGPTPSSTSSSSATSISTITPSTSGRAKLGLGPGAPAQPSSRTTSSLPPAIPVPQGVKPPVLIVSNRMSKQPVFDRRKALQRLFEEFCTCYTSILPTNPTLPSEHALAQEQTIASSTTAHTYNRTIHSTLISIRSRTKPPTLDSVYVGTVEDSARKVKEESEKLKGRLTRKRLEKGGYLLPKEDLAIWGYMSEVPTPLNAAASSSSSSSAAATMFRPSSSTVSGVKTISSYPNGGGTKPNAIGEEKLCDRCSKPFTVSSTLSYLDLIGKREKSECIYHWGRPMPQRRDGKKEWVYSCCRELRGSEGCEDGLHVFKDGEKFRRFGGGGGIGDFAGVGTSGGNGVGVGGGGGEGGEVDEVEERRRWERELHDRVEFMTVEQVMKEDGDEKGKGKGRELTSGKDQKMDVVGIDCEMIYTTGGLSLARVTVLTEDGRPLLDEIVRQTETILDINTKFSGLTSEDLSPTKATLDIRSVRRLVCKFIGPETIIVGHGLENDLKALRLVHTNVVDSAIVFPHPKGPPYRRSLKDLVSEKLGVFIQSNILDAGHDSGADAKAALDLIKWKVREDHERGLHADE